MCTEAPVELVGPADAKIQGQTEHIKTADPRHEGLARALHIVHVAHVDLQEPYTPAAIDVRQLRLELLYRRCSFSRRAAGHIHGRVVGEEPLRTFISNA